MPAARTAKPATETGAKPKRATTRPVTPTMRIMIAAVMGSRAAPASKAP